MQRFLSENSYWPLLHFARKVDGARVENIIQSEKNTMSIHQLFRLTSLTGRYGEVFMQFGHFQ